MSAAPAAAVAPAPGLKTVLFQAAEALLMQKASYESIVQDFKAKIAAAPPTAKAPAMQAELIKAHDAYKRVMSESLASVESQYLIGQQFYTLLNETFKIENPNAAALQKVVQSLGEIKSKLDPLIAAFGELSRQVVVLERQIVDLIGAENAAAAKK